MFCQKCKTQVPERANYCWKCGKPMHPDIREEHWETMEVVFQEGETPESCCFAGKAIGQFGIYIFGTSPAFTCETGPNPRSRDQINKLDALVNRLLESGWEPAPERGPEWFSHRFKRKVAVTRHS